MVSHPSNNHTSNEQSVVSSYRTERQW